MTATMSMKRWSFSFTVHLNPRKQNVFFYKTKV
jgi:hypothetical protein